MCCSVLQCVAVCCSALQCNSVRFSALQCRAVCCSVSQCVAVCCSVLQCVAVCCSALSDGIPCFAIAHCSCVFVSTHRHKSKESTTPAPSSQGPLRHLRFPSPILDPDSARKRKRKSPHFLSVQIKTPLSLAKKEADRYFRKISFQ